MAGKVTKTSEEFLAEVNTMWDNEFELCREDDDTESKIYAGSRKPMSLKHKPCGTIVTKRADAFTETRCNYCRLHDSDTKEKIKVAQKEGIAKARDKRLKSTEQFLAEVNLKWNNEFEMCGDDDDVEAKEYTGGRKSLSLRHKICGTIATKNADAFFTGRCAFCYRNNAETIKKASEARQETMAENGTSYTTESFIKAVNEKWNDEFEYCDVEYVNARSPMSLRHIPCGTIVSKTTASKFFDGRCDYCRKNDPETVAKINQKMIETSREKYGVDRPSQAQEVKDKIAATNLERYGVESVLQLPENREKAKAAMIEKYGVDNPGASEEIRKKRWGKDFSDLTINQQKFHYPESLEEGLKELTLQLGRKPLIEEIVKFSGYAGSTTLYRNGLAKYTELYQKMFGTSKGEEEVANFISEHSDYLIERNNRTILADGKEIDIYLPELKIGIEYCGLYWHSSNPSAARGVPKPINYHLNKLLAAEQAGIRLIQIFESEWIMKPLITKAKLGSILNLNLERERVFARKCKIQPINSAQARDFCNNNHIQGYANASIREGLFYNDELVAVMTFIKSAVGYELSRYCTLLSKQVIGGASKLLKNSIKNYDLGEIHTFSDNRWSSRVQNMYIELGFDIVSYTNPNYFYWRGCTVNNFEMYHRASFQKSKLEKRLGKYDPNLTEIENVELFSNFNRIYDAGNIKYIYKKV